MRDGVTNMYLGRSQPTVQQIEATTSANTYFRSFVGIPKKLKLSWGGCGPIIECLSVSG
jgi:hypothetical protein